MEGKTKLNSGGFTARTAILVLAAAFAVVMAVVVASTILAADPPANFFTVVDADGPNDETAQNDLTQMGRDDTDPDKFKLFWNWDSVDFTAQAGNACALFDYDGDTLVDVVVCVEIENANTWTATDPVIWQSDDIPSNFPPGVGPSPYVFRCVDDYSYKCSQPSDPQMYAVGTDIESGTLFGLAASPTANLVTDTDPFPAGDFYPDDSSIQIHIEKSYLLSLAGDLGAKYPAITDPTPTLVNVCSYPSAANGGNNDYNDCIVSPGGGFLEIVKVAPDGTTQQFDYTINPGGISESITGAGTTGPIPLLVGTGYSVTEGMLDDWQLDSASCEIKTDGTTEPTGTPITMGVENIEIRSGLETVCTFTNSLRKGTINIHKTTSPSGGAGFNFTDDIESPYSFSLNDGDVKTFSDVVSGTYSVTESDPGPAYSLTSLTCTDSDTGGTDSTWDLGTRTANINLDPGETVDCYYTNTAVDPQIRVIKDLVPAEDGGLFNLAINSTDYVTDSGDGADTGFVSVSSLTGNSVSETAGTGTSLSDYDTSISCDNGDSGSGASLDLSPLSYGDQITCTITNSRLAQVRVIKDLVPADDGGLFNLAINSTDYVTDGGDGADTGFVNLASLTGNSVSETAGTGTSLSDYDLSISCDNGDSASAASLDLSPLSYGDQVTCTITNSRLAQIRVIKDLVPADDGGLFNLAINSTDYVTDGGDGADTGFVNLASLTGNSVSETAGTGTSLSDYDTSISCDNGDSASGASLDLSPLSYGDQVTCTITNQKDSYIIVEKQTDPAGATQEFPFQASWLGDGSEEYDFTLMDNEQHDSGDLDPGTYSVSELVPSGWDIYDVACISSEGDTETEDSISLQAGETVTCVFTNEQDSKIIVEKLTDPAGQEQEFPFQASWLGDGSEEYDFLLSHGEQHDSGDLDPGTYSVSEVVPVGWWVKDVTCTSSKGDEETEDSISLQAGETVTCVFTNETREYRVTAGYEDLEVDDPLMDYDYNDWEIQIDITYNESRIDFLIEPLGRGGVNDHVFHIAIPGGKLTVDGEYTLTLYDENGIVISTETGDFDASAGEDFIVIPCTCEAFPPSGTVVNVFEGIFEPTQRTAEINIVLDGEEPNMGDLFQNGVGNHGEGLFFDPYIFVEESQEEIHQNDFRLLTVQLERSDPAWKWPEENVCLSNAYPLVTGFPPTFFFGDEWWAYPSENGCTYGDGEICELDSTARLCSAVFPPNTSIFLPLVQR